MHIYGLLLTLMVLLIMRVMRSCRIFPYSYETLVENLLDVGHGEFLPRSSLLSAPAV